MKFNEYKYERPNLESKNLKNTYSHLVEIIATARKENELLNVELKVKKVKRIFSVRDIYLKVKKKEKENARKNNN